MSIEIHCSNPVCKRRYTVPADRAGRSMKCGACGETFVASASKTEADDYLQPAWGDAKPAAPTATATMPGTIGRFAIRGKLGAGAFGTVYRAYDPQLDRVVALKVPNPGVMTDPKRAERFLREAKAAANLHHPHIVSVFDAGKDGDSLYIASAFIDGKSLSESIPEGGTEFARAARLARELAEALAYAHEQGVVHRDVKPANVMLDALDRTHLMDFGLASRQDEAGRLTNDGAVMGTPSYMSPEQARGQKGDARPATDQYAAGVVLYELLTGRTPFGGPVAAVIAAVLTTEPDPPRKVRPDVPKDLETICLKAMSKKPEDRYANCQALADDLRRWSEGEPVAARPLGLAERGVRWLKKEPKLAGAVAAVALTLLVSVLVVSDAARKANAALQQANSDKAARDEAEEREKQSASKEFGALGTAAEERRRAEKHLAEAKEAVKEASDARAETDRQSRRAAEAESQAAADRTKAVAEAANISAAQHALGAAQKNVETLQKRVDALQAEVDRIPARPAKFVGHTDWVYSVSFSADGKRLVTASIDRTVKVWDVKTGAEELTLKGHTDRVHSAVFSPDGTRILTTSDDKTTRVWNAKTGAELFQIAGTSGGQIARYSPDGTRILISDSAVKVCDAKTGAAILALKGESGVVSAAFSPDGRRIGTGGAGGTVKVWDVKGTDLLTLKGHGSRVHSVAFSPDGTRIMAASETGAVKIWDAKTGAEVLSFGHSGEMLDTVYAAALSPDGTRVVTGSRIGTVRVWSSKTGAELLSHDAYTDNPTSISFCPDGLRVVAAGQRGTVKMWWVVVPAAPAKK